MAVDKRARLPIFIPRQILQKGVSLGPLVNQTHWCIAISVAPKEKIVMKRLLK